LSGAVVKLASITFLSLAFSYWTIKPWFLNEGKFAAIFIIPSSWGSQRDGDLHQHRHNKQQPPYLFPQFFWSAFLVAPVQKWIKMDLGQK
jgi:hypothetical protein